MKHETTTPPHDQTYSPDGTQLGRTIFGVFVLLAFLVPTLIVTVQWLFPEPGVAPRTDPAVIPVACALMLWPLWQIGARNLVHVDAAAKTISWQRSIFGLRFKTEVWNWDDVTSIEVARNPVMKSSSTGYYACAAGPRGRRYLLTYFHGTHPPEHIRDTARMLGLQIQIQD